MCGVTDQAVTATDATGLASAEVAGLTSQEVADRVRRGLANVADDRTSRSLAHIVRANVLTRFNAVLGALLVLVLATGAWADATFGIVVVVNALVGIVQELRAKRALDRLAVLSAPRARVIRDGVTTEVPLEQVVLDDVVELRPGDQVPADGTVLRAAELEVDESLLTGESDPVVKAPGAPVLSGSSVVAGCGLARTTQVGADAYARRIAADAKRFTLTHSELVAGVNRLLRWISWVLVIVGPILIYSQLRAHEGWRDAVRGAAAGMVGMVPEGLVLLTSVAFGVAALALARLAVLVQELPAVEVLARVDVICLDKTGTLTAGVISFGGLEPVLTYVPAGPGVPARPGTRALAEHELGDVLGALAAVPAPNPTLRALGRAFPEPSGWTRQAAVAFSSARKWSGVTFDGRGTWILGAPEIVLHRSEADGAALHRAGELAAAGRRVLVLARAASLPTPDDGDRGPGGNRTPDGALRPPADTEPVALLLFDEQLRPDAAETIAYFAAQGVAVKVISGDNPRTIGAVAARVGIPAGNRPGSAGVVDARELPDDLDALGAAVESASVFGRVTPQQKRAMVRALQARGHVVAMTGDGVNDALALKDADIGIAMGSAAAATRAVAQLVLLDDRFARLPPVVAEGRRVMANIERVASLFVVKNVYSAILSLAVAVASLPFPFLPRHLTLISMLTIGLPAFVLALAPNPARFSPGFLTRVLRFSLPGGVLIGAGVYASYAVSRVLGMTNAQSQTAACVTVMIAGLWILVLLARPVRAWKLALVSAMAGAFVAALVVPPVRDFLLLELPLGAFGEAVAIGVAVAAGLSAVRRMMLRRR